jgi:hypothetical protein
VHSCWKLSILLLLLPSCFACNRSESAIEPPLSNPEYAALPGLERTPNQELQAELARLLAEQATPLQLMSSNPLSASDQHEHDVALDVPVSVLRLDTAFPRNFRDAARERIANIWPAEGFAFTPATLHVITAMAKRHHIKREQYVQLVSRADFALSVDHSLGLAADTSYLDAIEIGHRLEGLRAAELLANNRPDAAIESLRIMFHVSEELADQMSLVSRGAGAMRRRDALQVLGGIARHPKSTLAIHQQLEELLAQQLEQWPADAKAWIGDRAQGLHTYELVRDGQLLSLFTPTEIQEYRMEVGIKQLASLVADNLNRDELFYLHTMRDVIAACRKPHYERIAMFQQIETNLELLRNGQDYPFVADQLLLIELEKASRLFALDRARCDAWSLALQLARGVSIVKPPVNPLTGEHFFFDITNEQVIVDAITSDGSEPAAIVPWAQQTSQEKLQARNVSE